jgi:hypothetical protein
MKSFEIQLFHKGKWETDSIYDDRERAVTEARRMEGSSRYGSLRVVREAYDDQTGNTSFRTVYRDSQSQSQVAQQTNSALEEARELRNDKNRQGIDEGTHRMPMARTVNIFLIEIKLGLIGQLGIRGMWGLQYLSL